MGNSCHLWISFSSSSRVDAHWVTSLDAGFRWLDYYRLLWYLWLYGTNEMVTLRAWLPIRRAGSDPVPCAPPARASFCCWRLGYVHEARDTVCEKGRGVVGVRAQVFFCYLTNRWDARGFVSNCNKPGRLFGLVQCIETDTRRCLALRPPASTGGRRARSVVSGRSRCTQLYDPFMTHVSCAHYKALGK